MTLRVGIIGCGKIADAHVEQVRAIGGAEVVAVCDTEPLMAEQLGVRFSISGRYASMAEMLATERLDVVHVTTPPQSHPEIAIAALTAGCHVFVEKPLAVDAIAAASIIDAAVWTGRKLSINHWLNFEEPTLRLRSMLDTGELGDVIHVESLFGYDLSGDYGAAVLGDPAHWVHRLPGKLFHNVLDHVVSKLALVIPDADPTIVAMDYRRRPDSGNATLDRLSDELRFFCRGARTSGYGMISAHARPAAHMLRVYGTRNTAVLDYHNRTTVLESEQRFPSALGRLQPAFVMAKQYRRCGLENAKSFLRADFHFFAGMRRLLSAFYSSIRSDSQLPIPYSEMSRIARMIDRIVADLAQGREAVGVGH